MNRIDTLKYRIILGLLRSLARLPLGALYVLSDAASFVVHSVVRYRLGVVRTNLRNAFPEKSAHERRRIERQFYAYLCDCIVETIKLLHISDAELMRRIAFRDVAVIDRLASGPGQPVVLFLGHYGNWEWVQAISFVLHRPQVTGALYRPLKNKVADRLMLRIRSRFDNLCIPMKQAYRTMLRLKCEGTPFTIGFIADQRPTGRIHEGHEVDFLGLRTAFLTGGETIGQKIGARFVYLDIVRPRRGHYEITFREIRPAAAPVTAYPYTEAFLEMLEQTIRRAPAFWLWSHNRWRLPRK